MKAHEIMMFLLLFNLCVSLVGILNIYPFGLKTAEEYNVSEFEAQPTPNEQDSTFWLFVGTSVSALALGVIAGAMTSWLTRIPTDAGIAYSIFVTQFWNITLNASFVILVKCMVIVLESIRSKESLKT